jgi:hypothetical protein
VIAWEASDSDKEALTFDVLFRSGPGEPWLPVATGISAKRTAIDTRLLPGGSEGQVRVLATDGVNTTSVEASAPTIPEKPPLVGIYSPRDGAEFQGGAPLELIGFAYDPEDGIVADSGLAWHSNRDGDLGRGARATAANLSAGTHAITLTATDNDGRRSTHRATIRVGRKTPPTGERKAN